jgi:DNA-binding response OmpR family regulator
MDLREESRTRKSEPWKSTDWGYDYLMKPCPLNELLLKIEAAFEKKVERESRTKKSKRPEGPA